MEFAPGQRVRIAPGFYRVGRSPNSHIAIGDGATGTVRLVYEPRSLVLVYLDASALSNPHAPQTAMVPPANLSAA